MRMLVQLTGADAGVIATVGVVTTVGALLSAAAETGNLSV